CSPVQAPTSQAARRVVPLLQPALQGLVALTSSGPFFVPIGCVLFLSHRLAYVGTTRTAFPHAAQAQRVGPNWEEPAWGSTERFAGWASSTTDRSSRTPRTTTTTSGRWAGFASPSSISSWRNGSGCESKGFLRATRSSTPHG